MGKLDEQSEMYAGCVANNDACKTCVDNKCNSKDHFLKCSTSKALAPRAQHTYDFDSKICHHYNDQCFTHIVGEKSDIVRGCLQEYAERHHFSDEYVERNLKTPSYRTCITPMCNDEEIREEHCIVCDSSENENCRNNVTMEMRKKCPLNFLSDVRINNGCFHYVDSNTNLVQRGCLVAASENLQEICKIDSELCKSCVGDSCNKRTSFLQCLSCAYDMNNKSTCDSEVCSQYHDECFTHIDVSNNFVRKGCLSKAIKDPDIGTGLMNDCQNENHCVKCSDTNDCNNIEPNETNENCIKCDSHSDFFCTFHPTANMSVKCTLSFKPMGCYLKRDDNLMVSRGCMSDVDLKTQNTCRNGTTTCKMCMGNDCNLKRSFQLCHTCDSSNAVDGSCIDRPWIAKEEQCTNYLGECYTHVENEVVRRGCIGDGIVAEAKDCSDSSVCERCSDSGGCNSNEIKRESCVTCNSQQDPTCQTNSTYTVYQDCPLSAKPMGCYHLFNPKINATKRGCVKNLSESENKECDENVENCKKCIGSNCNARKDFERCLTCDSSVNEHCALNPINVETNVCEHYDDQCFSYIGKSKVTRGCLNENNNDFIMMCRANPSKCGNCSSTNNIGCNNQIINLETCVDCDSIRDENCKLEPGKVGDSLCSVMNQEQRGGCYTSIMGNRIKRGCVNHLSEDDKRACLKNSDNCKYCTGKNCNKKAQFQKCYTCNSRDDPNCAQDSTMINISTCKEYLSACLVGIDAHGNTHRRCAKKYVVDKAEMSNGLEICLQNECNKYVFPKHRLQCHQCDGDSDCDLMPTSSTETDLIASVPKPCNIQSDHDQCYTYINESK